MPDLYDKLRRAGDTEQRKHYRQYLAQRLGPMLHALMLVASLTYVLGVVASTLIGQPTVPLWVRLAPLAPLLLVVWATRRPREPGLLSLLTLLYIFLLEVGINLNSFTVHGQHNMMLPGLLLPVATSVIWLTRRDFLAGMVLCTLGPLPMLIGREDRVVMVQFLIYMAISIAVATVLRAFTSRTLAAQYRLEQQLREQANSDGLTGLLLRNRFLELGTQALDQAGDKQQPLCMLYLDADHFKPLNDDFGHAAGDAVLIALAATTRKQMRHEDLIGRIGGEEFAMLLPGIDLAQATQRAEQLRVAMHEIPRPDGRLTVSIGVVQNQPGNETIQSLLARADQAMHQAKRAGRDRVVSVAAGSDPGAA